MLLKTICIGGALAITAVTLPPALAAKKCEPDTAQQEKSLAGEWPYRNDDFIYESRVTATKDASVFSYKYCIKNRDTFSIDVNWFRSDGKMYFDHRVPPKQERQSSADYTGGYDTASRILEYSGSSPIVPETVFNPGVENQAPQPRHLEQLLSNPRELRSFIEGSGELVLSANATYDIPPVEIRDGDYDISHYRPDDFIVFTVDFSSKISAENPLMLVQSLSVKPEELNVVRFEEMMKKERVYLSIRDTEGGAVFENMGIVQVQNAGEILRRTIIVDGPLEAREAQIRVFDDMSGDEIGSMFMAYWRER